MQMRICYICPDHGIPVRGAKGSSIHINEFIKALRGQDVECSLICSDMGAGRASAGFHEIRNYPVFYHMPDELKDLGYNLALYLKGGKIIREEKPSIIHERLGKFNMAGLRLARKYRIPYVLEVNSPMAAEAAGYSGSLRLSRLAWSMENSLLSKADAVITVSNTLKRMLEKRGVSGEKIHVVPNGVDPEMFRPSTTKRKGVTVGFVGSLKAWHGVDMLFDCIPKILRKDDSIRFLIVGSGPEEEKLKAFVRENKLERSVSFAGSVNYKEIPDYINRMDIAVAPYPKLRNFYFSPIKIFEYMACGKAIIASDIGQIGEVLEDGKDAVLVRPGSRRQLTSAILKLAKDRGMMKKLGKNACKGSKEYSWAANAGKIRRIYRKLASGGGS